MQQPKSATDPVLNKQVLMPRNTETVSRGIRSVTTKQHYKSIASVVI